MSDQNLPEQNKSNQNMNAQPETASDQLAPDDATINGNLFVTNYVAVGPFGVIPGQGIIEATGSLAAFSFVRRDLTSRPAELPAGNRFVWYNPDGTARLYTDVNRDLLTVTAPGNVGIGTTNPEAKLHISDPSFRGNMKLFATSGVGHDFGYDGGIDNFFAFAHYGLESGQTKFVWHQNEAATRDLLTIKNTGNIGIGTADFSLSLNKTQLHVEGKLIYSGGSLGGLSFGNRDTSGFVENPTKGERWTWYSSGGTARLWSSQDRLSIDGNGYVSIGTTTPLQYARVTIQDAAVPLAFRESDRAVTEGGLWRMPLDAGILRFDVNTSASGNFSPSIPVLSMYPNGDVRVTGDVYARNQILSSSRELKENIAELSGKEAVEALKNLNPVKFNFKADSDKNRHIGFIAEDVPELVATSDRKTLSPMDIVAVLTQALKEQQNTISALAEKVKVLEAKTA